LLTNPSANQTYSFSFGTNNAGLVVSGFQNFIIEVINPGVQNVTLANPSFTGNVSGLFSDTVGAGSGAATNENTGAVHNLTIVGASSGAGAVGTSLDPTTLLEMQADIGKAYAGNVTPPAYTTSGLAGTYGSLRIDSAGNYTYTLNPNAQLGASANDIFTLTTMDGNGFITATTVTFSAIFFPDPAKEHDACTSCRFRAYSTRNILRLLSLCFVSAGNQRSGKAGTAALPHGGPTHSDRVYHCTSSQSESCSRARRPQNYRRSVESVARCYCAAAATALASSRDDAATIAWNSLRISG
jgi:VCBS repeat-containing protein